MNFKNRHYKERLESITRHDIGHVLAKKNGKYKTLLYRDYTVNKWMKATLKYDCLISNIREDKNLQ